MAEWVKGDYSIADIGTDHGYLPYSLLSEGNIKKAILSDINIGPLDNSKNTFKDSELNSNVEFRLGSGIDSIEYSEVDFVFVAGMGGGLIKSILSANLEKSHSYKGFFLQPQTEQDVLRGWLLENDFHIVNDLYTFEDNKFYEALYVISNRNENAIILTQATEDFKVYRLTNDLEFGYSIQAKSLKCYREFLINKQKKYEYIYDKIMSSNKEENKISIVCSKLEAIKNILVEV